MYLDVERNFVKRAIAPILSAALLLSLGAAPAAADGPGGSTDPTSIEPGCYTPDIGTVETALAISSSVDEVCFETPRLVDREHMKFYEVTLQISGVDSTTWRPDCFGYSGEPGCGHRQATYEDVGVTLWFPRNWEHGKDKTLVQYHFSGSFSSLEGETVIGLGAIQQGMAYVAHDGPEDGATGFLVGEPFAGAPVPLVSSSMTRDVGSVASDWLERYVNRAPDLRYISGWSFGAWVITGLVAGNFFGAPMGNNHRDPNDLDSAPFYDAALYMGSGGGPAFGPEPTVPGTTATPIPSIFIEGEQEVTDRLPYVASWIDLVGSARAPESIALWSLRGEGHGVIEAAPQNEADLILHDYRGPVVAAALASLHRAVTKGEPMTTYLGGAIVSREPGDPSGDGCIFGSGGPDPDRRIEWQTLDGVATYRTLVKLYSNDVVAADFPPEDREPCQPEIEAFARIQDSLNPEPAILPPLAANRIGPTFITGFGNVLIAGEQNDVCTEYGDLEGYVKALEDTAGELRGMGVWRPFRGSTGVRVTGVTEAPPWFPLPGPFPGIVGTFQEQGCA